MENTTLRLFAIFAFGSAALSARATLLDFEDVAGGTVGDPVADYTDYPSPLTTRGYVLTADKGVTSVNPGFPDSVLNYTGSVALAPTYNVPLDVTRAGGGAFDLHGMDVANVFRQSGGAGSGAVVFTGTFAGGGTITRSYTLPLDDAVHHLDFAGFTNLGSLEIDDTAVGIAENFHVQYDNVSVSAVPEPASMAVLGLGALGLLRRHRA